MGKVTGFLEYQRLQEASEAPQTRTKHYKEFMLHLSDADAKVQGARCMDCGIPFCNSGCPVNNIIPDWNDSTRCTPPITFLNLRAAFVPRLVNLPARWVSTMIR
jgi:ferredoxin